ncbi:MAG TPA: S-adenosylmethionine:tRNA ribosyltransferase-isomerase, partial [Anaerolineales bacterium]
MNTAPLSAIEFSLPSELEASAPPEARGLRRDQVRLMVSNYSTDQVKHTRFYHLDKYLNEGDVLVINTSRTRNSALVASRANGTVVELHLS